MGGLLFVAGGVGGVGGDDVGVFVRVEDGFPAVEIEIEVFGAGMPFTVTEAVSVLSVVTPRTVSVLPSGDQVAEVMTVAGGSSSTGVSNSGQGMFLTSVTRDSFPVRGGSSL